MISKIVLEKEGRTVVLCGVKHVEKQKLYEGIQEEIDQAVAGGYAFFYEGIRRDPSVKLTTTNAKRLMTFWRGIIGIGYQNLAEMREWKTQKANLTYPQEGINADISLEELVNTSDKAGVKCSRALLYVVSALLVKKPTMVSEYPLVLRVAMAIAKRHFSAWFQKDFWSLLHRSFPFTVDYRNETIFRIVMDRAGQRNILMLYGISHLPGLLKHFESSGWKIKQSSEKIAK